jgi:hypothetical protein
MYIVCSETFASPCLSLVQIFERRAKQVSMA